MYVQLSLDKVVMNTMNSYTIGTITLDPKGMNMNYNIMFLGTWLELY